MVFKRREEVNKLQPVFSKKKAVFRIPGIIICVSDFITPLFGLKHFDRLLD